MIKLNFVKVFFTAIFLFVFNRCNGQGDFEKFIKTFKTIQLPFVINDSIAFDSWDTKDLIDTNDIRKYDLLSHHIARDYPYEYALEYKCSSVGKYETDTHIILLYKMYTTQAGRGNPQIILAVFSKNGKKKDETAVLWNDADDPLYRQRVTLKLIFKNKIEIRALKCVNGLLNNKIVPKKITEKIIYYSIKTNGKIVETKKLQKDVFKDNNPRILDDFSE